MTVTEAPPSAPAETSSEAQPERRGPAALFGTGDHKTVGRLWIGASALFLLLVVVVGALLGFERVDLGSNEVLGNDHVLQFFSLYRFGLTFLVVVPLFIGLATAIVPLQVGASTLAFPRAAAAALWTWFGGAALLLVSYALDGGPVGTGDADAEALGILGLGLAVLGLLVAVVCVVTTVIALRTPYQSLAQVPPFAWSMVVAGVIWLLSFPVLLAGLLLAYLDLRHGGLAFATPDTLFQRLDWVFVQPQVYALAIPALGVAAEVVPVSAGVVQRHRGVIWAGIGGFGAFAFGAWAQPFWRDRVAEDAPYVVVAFAIGLPLLLVLGGLADCARQNRPKPNAALVLVGLSLLVLLAAVGAGAATAVDAFELYGTSWQTGHLDLVFGASLLAAAAGLTWWAPKIWGRHLPGPAALLGGLALAGGAVVAGVGQGIAGALDQLAFPFADYGPGGLPVPDGVETLNLVSAIGSVLLALGAVLVVLGLLKAALGRTVADDADDPWGGQTLEWSTTSPPPAGNFAEPVPEVTSATPLVTDEEGA
jgi:heme/copper-type cytochrome/quinol oxidase subunit 1